MDHSTSVIPSESDLTKKCESIVYASCDALKTTNTDSADELFSDVEDKKDNSTYYSPRVPQADQSTFNLSDLPFLSTDLQATPRIPQADQSTLNLSDLPFLSTDWEATTPDTAVVPSIPLSLIPILTKVNEQWSSDLETPQGEKTNRRLLDPAAYSRESAEKSSVSKPLPVNMSQSKTDEKGDYGHLTSSPILITKKARRRPKRRIFKSMHSPESTSKIAKNETNTDSTSTCLTTTVMEETISHVNPLENGVSNHRNESAELKPDSNSENSHNTSTQNFFNNMSFSNIDRICAENCETQKKKLEDTNHGNNRINQIESEDSSITNENMNTKDVSDISVKNSSVRFGFQTASGKAVNISEAALSKVQSLFLEDLNESHESTNVINASKSINEKKDYPLSKFASGTSVKINSEAIKKAEILFIDQISQKENESTVNLESNCIPFKKIEVPKYKEKDKDTVRIDKSFVGFETARGQPISVTKSVLDKVKTMFSEEINNDEKLLDTEKKIERSTLANKQSDVERTLLQTSSRHSVPLKKAELSNLLLSGDAESLQQNNSLNRITMCKSRHSTCGFETASGRQVVVSERVIQKVKSLFSEDTEDTEEKIYSMKDSLNNIGKYNPSSSGFGFQTAGGREITVSDTALQKVKSLFVEDNESVGDKEGSNRNLLKKVLNNEPTHTVFGFETASGRRVSLSQRVLHKEGSLFSENIDSTEEKPHGTKDSSNNIAKNKPSVAGVGFRADSGRRLSISEAALQRQVPTKDCLSNITNNKPSSTGFGFQTASGRQISVSEAALQKVQSLFAEETGEQKEKKDLKVDSSSDITNKKSSSTGFGFQTASGRQISVSEAALQKVQSLFAEETDDQKEKKDLTVDSSSAITNKKSSSTGFGFQTASGRQISVSEAALQKVNSLFVDETDDQKEKEDSKKDPSSDITKYKSSSTGIGLQTASGRQISVSETALQKGNSLFPEKIEDFEEERTFTRHSLDKIADNRSSHSGVGFQTASGREISISEVALQKVRSLFPEETSEDDSNNSSLSNVSSKRKIHDSDECTPLGRKSNSSFKKVRVSLEFPARKLTYEDTRDDFNKTETKERQQKQLLNQIPRRSQSERLPNNNCLNGNINPREEMVCEDFLSEEILASTKALLADEVKSVAETIALPMNNNEEKETIHPASPVLGRRRRNPSQRKRSFKRLCMNQCNTENINKQIVKSEENSTTSDEKENKNQPTADYGDTQLILNFIDNSTNILQKRIDSALDQEKLIQEKRNKKPKPKAGKLFTYKRLNQKNRLTWRQVSNGKPPVPRSFNELVNTRISTEILNVTSKTASDYRFRCSDFYGYEFVQENTEGILVGEDTKLILDENGYAGLLEMKRAFLSISSVDPNLVPTGWVENHYKWIVWKLASMDRLKFYNTLLPRALTPTEVIAQLKYRYDREIDQAQRPAIRKIFEKDDLPSKRMVLCVSSIMEHTDVQSVNTSPKPSAFSVKKLILTDGWYSIPASVDQAMLRHISSGKVREGTKLLMYGAELSNCDQGCFPLEAPADVCLRIHTNSTRRARWDAKLGYVSPSRPIPVKLKNICPSGGLIGKIVVLVARVYPMLYHEKTTSGESIFRNARCEEKANLLYEQQCQAKTEAFYANAEKEFYKSKKTASSSSSDPDSMELVANELSEDCEKLTKDENLSSQERNRLLQQCRLKEEEFKGKLKSRLQESLPPPRQVKRLLKVRVTDADTSAILSIWTPSEDIVDMLKEGSSLCICNTTSSGSRTAELQLSAGRNTLFIPKSTCNINYPHRVYSALCEIGKPSFSPEYNEFDTVGVVVEIGNGPYGMKHFEAVYLAYPSKDSSESSYLSILFWQGITTHGYAEILSPGALVACSNLVRRRAMSSNIPIVYCTERTVFTRNPRQNHFCQALADFRAMKVDLPAYVSRCVEELAEETHKKSLPKTPDCNADKTKCEKNAVNGTVAEENSPFANNYTAKSSAIQMRLDKLHNYDEPPKLSPIVLKTSKRVLMDFRSPVRSTNRTKP